MPLIFDVTIKFMKPHAPATTFYWPARDDIVELPFDKILVKLEPPTCTSRSGQHYTITKEEEKKTNDGFQYLMSELSV